MTEQSTMKMRVFLAGLLWLAYGNAARLHAGEAAEPMKVAICPRLVTHPECGGERRFVRRVEDMFINETDQWRYVSNNISHFK